MKDNVRNNMKIFLISGILFVALAVPFKVMVLIEGFTEVRPVNALPMVIGLLFGPWGAAGCGVGNLIADLFGDYGHTSVLGLIANFVAAYMPYKLWYLFQKEEPNAHTWKNLFLIVFLAFITSLSVAAILGGGLDIFFGQWIPTVYMYVFLNELGFSLIIGLPIFIVLTSNEMVFPIWEYKKIWKHPIQKLKRIAVMLLLLLLILYGIGVFHAINGTLFLNAICLLCFLLILYVLI